MALLVYGSYGYVGSLVAEEAIDRGIDVLLAGQDGEEIAEQVDDLGVPGRRFDLDDPDTVAEALADVDCVLNCAGPFSNTAEPLAEGCIESGTDYVDITGEIPVVERVHDRDEAARDAGVTLLPASGFSAVPLDCLAAHLGEQLPGATSLALGAESFRPPSVGTLRTVVEGIESGGFVRKDGELEEVPAAWRTRYIDFGRGTHAAVTVPMAEVSTAHYTTEIPDVEAYAIMPQPGRAVLRAHRYLAPLLATTPARFALKRLVGLTELVREGPSEGARERGTVYCWGEARGDDERVVSRLRTPDAYVVTVDAAVTAAERVLDGETGAGFRTPAGAFGPEFVLDLDDVEGFFDGERPPEEWEIDVPMP